MDELRDELEKFAWNGGPNVKDDRHDTRPSAPADKCALASQTRTARQSGSEVESSLISKLPMELRRMIWSDFLGDLILDLTLTNGLLQLRPPHRSCNTISMLLACRQMYVDLSSVWK